MASFAKEFKLRQSAVTLAKRENHYENLKTFQNPTDVNGVAASTAFLAYIDTTGTGSALAVLPHSSIGKNHVPVSSPAYVQPIIRAHGQSIQDFEFSAFNPHHIYTCSSDKTVKLWQIPEEGLAIDMSAPELSISLEDQAPVKGIAVHPTAAGILAGRGSRSLTLFDIAGGRAVSSVPSKTASGVDMSALLPTSDYLSLAWSFRGDLLVTTAKDKQLRLFDPRSIGTYSSSICSVQGHVGLRFSRSIWLGDSPFLLTCGHNNAQEREVMVWDSRNMTGGCVKRERVDSGYGPLVPLYDADLNSLILMGKGDTSLRLYEAEFSGSMDSVTVHAVSNNTVAMGSADATRGACLLPKQLNDMMSCEVMRVLKLTDNCIQAVSITVPRKEKYKFHEDLFPHSVSGAAPAMTASEWLAGENVPLIRVPLVPKASILQLSNPSSACPSPVPGESGLKGDAAAGSEDGTVTPKSDASRALSKRFSSLASSSKFRHMYGTENTKDFSFFNLAPDLSAMDSPIVACNETYFAIPHRAGGGPVYVSSLAEYGKVEPDCSVVNDHKAPVQEISFSPFHPGLMATGSNDSTIKIWDVDSCFKQDNRSAAISSLEPTCSINKHTNSIRTVAFHPTVSGLLCSTAQDMTLRCFDAEQGSEVSCLQIPQAVTVNLTFNYDGSLMALAGKDRAVRIVDPRAGTVILSTENTLASAAAGSRTSATGSNPYLGRNLRVAWCATRTGVHADPLLTVSAGSNGMRQMHLWDQRSMQAPLITKSIDNGSGQLFPLFDETMKTVFLVGKGDTILRTYEMIFLEETTAAGAPAADAVLPGLLEKVTDFQSSIEPFAGVCMLPKRCCDVRNVEVARVLKLTSDALIPISFKVPRADHLKSFFHDDLYPSVRSRNALAAVPDWESTDADVAVFQPLLESLQPEGMAKVSESTPDPTPSSTRSKVDSFRLEQKRVEEESKLREDKFARLQNLAVQNSQYNKNLSGGVSNAPTAAAAAKAAEPEEVDSDDNWDDDN